ncbi:hypothetical protein TNCT_641011 [Trichonephila clavata]|uniref:Uncharacterized protein n=1 Tax=Trichonephila clavata TaxID=2740835 RepID=A0A8X6G006_TRICU|nr:hypothetical protein TNCT_641011 [Trichonephila clavata]
MKQNALNSSGRKATKENLIEERLSCVSSHMGREVISVMEQCMSDASKAEGNSTHSVKEFCEQLTHVPEWVAKHTNPPHNSLG